MFFCDTAKRPRRAERRAARPADRESHDGIAHRPARASTTRTVKGAAANGRAAPSNGQRESNVRIIAHD